MTTRPAGADDLAAIESIQRASPEASQWNPADYLAHVCTVAVEDGRVLGFVVVREITPGESEILNVAIHPEWRRRGIARGLVEEALAGSPGEWFLEVRESNAAARKLYQTLGFRAVGRRDNYYSGSPEAAIVMRFFS